MTDNTMTLLLDQIQASTDGDFLRAITAHTLQRLMEFEVDSLIGAGRHERSDERITYRCRSASNIGPGPKTYLGQKSGLSGVG